ncbi:hypothetical protein Nepgr_011053 [Nepenthes gracilis]|uniref:Uncharacterized protein n=1 Tax=Nepenthes gracilis TaxID=150966 RepID=A0AAD3SDH6_NEPGR|nr:hypothetical protein Nepgr_011053 [Nepenthes gracilis]
MVFYADEEEVWKCMRHPSRRLRIGICPVCLWERLSALCPECGNLRPCSCCTSSASSSSSSSLTSGSNSSAFAVRSISRSSNLSHSDASFRRSRSVSLPFFRSARLLGNDAVDRRIPAAASQSKTSFWSFLWPARSNKGMVEQIEENPKMRRSMSAAVSHSGRDEGRTSAKSKGWHFPSPMKVFRLPRLVQQQSPLYRG